MGIYLRYHRFHRDHYGSVHILILSVALATNRQTVHVAVFVLRPCDGSYHTVHDLDPKEHPCVVLDRRLSSNVRRRINFVDGELADGKNVLLQE